MKNPFAKLLTKTLTSAAQSIVSGEIKKHAKGLIQKYTAKSPEAARAEASAKLGYETDAFTLDKKENVVFKPSPIFMHEWLTNSPLTATKMLKDEEYGQFYYDGKLMTPSMKVEILTKFSKATGIHSPAISGHFDRALDLLDVTDVTALRFKEEFVGSWDPSRTSIIDSWLSKCFGTALDTDAAYANMLFRKWVVGTAHRAMNPGSTLDGCLVLKGPPGVGKTQFFRKLLPEPFANRTGEIYCDVKSPQRFVEAIVGKTVACFDELSVLDHPKSDETFKQLLSTQDIDVRLAWARKKARYALRQGFAGTTNKDKFCDKFLSRRLWVIQLNGSQRLNFDYLNDNCKSLWTEAAYYATTTKASYILSPSEQSEVEQNNIKYG